MPRRPTPRALPALRAVRDSEGNALDPSVPPVPSNLSDKSKQAWVKLWSSPIARVLVPELDGDTIEILLRLRDERDTEFRMGKRQRIVMGSQGQPVINPALANAVQIQKEIRTIEASLGLNPNARLKLGILLGEASRSINDVNEAFEDGEIGDVDLDDDDTPAQTRRTG